MASGTDMSRVEYVRHHQLEDALSQALRASVTKKEPRPLAAMASHLLAQDYSRNNDSANQALTQDASKSTQLFLQIQALQNELLLALQDEYSGSDGSLVGVEPERERAFGWDEKQLRQFYARKQASLALSAGPPLGKGEDPHSQMWFLVSKRHLHKFEYMETKELNSEYWEGHPNRCDSLADFLCIRLTLEQLRKQVDSVRLSSYRWRDVATAGDYTPITVPANYSWFLEYIDNNAMIGWMDFMSNVCVGVHVSHTLAYMGMLYAEVMTCAEWLVEPLKIPDAMSRGWIYQESTFGFLDRETVVQLATYLQEEYRREHDQKSAENYVTIIWNLSLVLLRRGHENSFTRDPEDMGGWDKYYDSRNGFFTGGKAEEYWSKIHPTASSCVKRLVETAEMPGITVVHLIESVSVRSREGLIDWLMARLGKPATDVCADAESFISRYSVGMLRAYCGADFTAEGDRDIAITASALHILETHFACKYTSEELMARVWIEGAKICYSHDVHCTLECRVNPRYACRVKNGFVIGHLHVIPNDGALRSRMSCRSPLFDDADEFAGKSVSVVLKCAPENLEQVRSITLG